MGTQPQQELPDLSFLAPAFSATNVSLNIAFTAFGKLEKNKLQVIYNFSSIPTLEQGDTATQTHIFFQFPSGSLPRYQMKFPLPSVGPHHPSILNEALCIHQLQIPVSTLAPQTHDLFLLCREIISVIVKSPHFSDNIQCWSSLF